MNVKVIMYLKMQVAKKRNVDSDFDKEQFEMEKEIIKKMKLNNEQCANSTGEV